MIKWGMIQWGGSVICILKMGEFLAGFVFYFYLCGDLS